MPQFDQKEHDVSASEIPDRGYASDNEIPPEQDNGEKLVPLEILLPDELSQAIIEDNEEFLANQPAYITPTLTEEAEED